jgi:hypothetical protein
VPLKASLSIHDWEALMEPLEISVATSETRDEREWELADEELDRTAQDLGRGITSRPCVCQQCSSPSHCR